MRSSSSFALSCGKDAGSSQSPCSARPRQADAARSGSAQLPGPPREISLRYAPFAGDEVRRASGHARPEIMPAITGLRARQDEIAAELLDLVGQAR